MTATSSRIRPWAWVAVPIAGVALTLVYFVLPTASTEQSLVYDLLGLGAVAAALGAVRAYRPAGWQPWVLMSLGQLLFVAGDIIWTVYSVQGQDPFPSIADVAYLAGYPVFALGLGAAIRLRVMGGDRAGLLDGAILATGAAVIWWTFILGPLAAFSEADALSFGISVAYPLGDLILIGMALAMVMTPGARSPSFAFLMASLVVLLAADVVYSLQTLDESYADGSWLDGLWLLAYITFATAAVHPSMAVLTEPRPVAVALLGPVRLLLLAAAMLVGPVLLVVSRSDGDAVVLVAAAATAILSVLVLSRLAGMVRILARDIARREVLEEQLSYQAFHDPLTGLANRRRFIEEVRGALASGRGTAALFLDLDDFKHVNDHMGHDAGDELLEAVGRRILASIRPGDVASRLGGDEFAVLLPATERLADAEAVATRLLESLTAPVLIEGVDVPVSGSVGVAVVGPDEGVGVDDLIRRADVAMYHAKARGKHRAASYSADLDAGDPTAPTRAPVRRSAPAA